MVTLSKGGLAAERFDGAIPLFAHDLQFGCEFARPGMQVHISEEVMLDRVKRRGGVAEFKDWLYRFRSFWIFPLLALGLVYLASRVEPDRRFRDFFWLFPIGIMIWTLLEYGLHRFVFHIQIPVRNPRLREILNASHAAHHASPRDPGKVLVRPLFGLVISAILYGLLSTVMKSFFSAAGVMLGIWAGFLYYEVVHYSVHFSLSPSGLIAGQRRAHFYHHFANNKRCFGVTSPLWDYVFGTVITNRVLKNSYRATVAPLYERRLFLESTKYRRS